MTQATSSLAWRGVSNPLNHPTSRFEFVMVGDASTGPR
jgi:hypothetical protein